jgi:predicted MPP superfamily phosphohydrolase
MPVLSRSLIVCLLGACNLNQSGNLGATSLGDTDHPLERGSPIAALRAQCGDGTPLDGGATIKREPYLQQLSTTGTLLGWVTTDASAELVQLSTGASIPAADEPGNLRSAGEKQKWATVDGLTANTTYCYTLMAGSAMTAPTGFKTPPSPDSTETIRILAFGDSGGGGSDQKALLDQMFDVPYDLMIHTGDIAYEDGTLAQFEANVFNIYADLFRNIPFFPAAGNHEYNTSTAAPFRSVFALPGDSGEKWYSYDWGRVHFAALDTEADYATQAAWLDADLAASTAPWKIVYLHRPPYSSGEHGSDTGLRSKLAPVLAAHHVQLVLAGHDHDYERMVPQDGVSYVVTGGGGRGTRPVSSSSFTAFAAEVIHFVYLEVTADQLVMHAIDGTGTEFDSMVVSTPR